MYQLLVSAAEAKKIFHDKLFNRYLTVKKAYRALDMEGTGRVSYASVREMLAEMGANMNDEQFAMFIKDLDPACKNSAAVCVEDLIADFPCVCCFLSPLALCRRWLRHLHPL